MTTFDTSLKELTPLYFHFLDGYLNPKFGSKLNVVYNLIINYNLIEINDETKKIFFFKNKTE